MSFFDRYAAACKANNIDPCSIKIAENLGISKSTASSWNTDKAIPHGRIVVKIADYLHVSADYLLERTDDPTDLKDNPPMISLEQKQLIEKFDRLDAEDRDRIMRFISFELTTSPKYKNRGTD